MSNSFQRSVPLKGGTYRTNVNWDEVRVRDPVEIRSDPCGRITGDFHRDPNALAVYHKNVHIGYLGADIAANLSPYFKLGAINLIGTVAFKSAPGRVELFLTIKEPEPDELGPPPNY